MKVFLSYKQTWIEPQELENTLWTIRNFLHSQWIENFIYYFDHDFKSQNAKEIIYNARKQIKESDIVIWFINYPWRSEGMMQELWMAYTLNKSVILIVNNTVKDEYFLSYGIAHTTLYFDNISQIPELLESNL